ncbi:MAG: prepilin peptidase [Actinomycetota bacterium]
MILEQSMTSHIPFARTGGGDTALMLAGLLPLFAILLVAVVTDVRARRIPNPLVLAGIATGLFLHAALPEGNGFLSKWPGSLGVLSSVQGLAIGAGAMFPLYFLRVMGAGDVKLMAAVGAILGADDIVPAILGTFIAGGVVSVAVAVAAGNAGQLLRNLYYMVQVTLLKLALPGRPSVEPPIESAGSAPYAVAVALGTLGGLWWVASGAV